MNLLFILTDNQRADLMGCSGNPIIQTPNLDQLAETGVRFSNAFATTPICAASRASYLTGLYERRHQFTFLTPPMRREFTAVSYPEILHLDAAESDKRDDLPMFFPNNTYFDPKIVIRKRA